MNKPSRYIAKQPDAQGIIHYSAEEHAVWKDLYQAQSLRIKDRMCQEYCDGLEYLVLPAEKIPQCIDLSEKLTQMTGWTVQPVPALINFDTFFKMLSQKQFPAASFIRRREDFDYLQEPDIFHEIFGHVPLLSNTAFATFTQRIGNLGITLPKPYHVWLARLYWMTIEFGLIQTPQGIRAYGAGLASSKGELQYALESAIPLREPFNLLNALRTGYRIDIMQPIYYVLESFEQLLALDETTIIDAIEQAMCLGLFPPNYSKMEKTA